MRLLLRIIKRAYQNNPHDPRPADREQFYRVVRRAMIDSSNRHSYRREVGNVLSGAGSRLYP